MEALDNDIRLSGSLGANAVSDMRSAAGWKRFIGIAGLVIALICTCFFAYLFFRSYRYDEYLIAGIAAVLCALVSLMCIFMIRSASSLYEFAEKKREPEFEHYVRRQKQFWLVFGIATMVAILFMAVILFFIMFPRSYYID
ncbi:MAG TPA: hypothetical protein VI112_08745 [Bacteroidia bacterium]|jgi:Na+/melibiose symporter-like transporter